MKLVTCPYCGALLDDDYEYCPYCGQHLETNKEETNKEEVFEKPVQGHKSDAWVEKWKRKQFGESYIVPVIFTTIFVVLFFFLLSLIAEANDLNEKYGRDGSGGLIGLYVFFYSAIFLIIIIAIFVEFTGKKFVVKKVDGYTIVAAKYGHRNFLIVDDVVVDRQHYYASRYGSNMRALTGNLPNGKNVWAEFRPSIVIHVGNDTIR